MDREDKLTDRDIEFLRGFDWCTEMAVDNFFDNDLGMIADPETYIGHFMNEELPDVMREEYEMEFTFGDRETEKREVITYGDYIRSRMLDWIESARAELVEAMAEDNV